MKKFSFLVLLCLVVSISCKKKIVDTPVDEQTPFAYSSLAADPQTIPIDGYTALAAVASGDDLTYTWECEYGTPLGSGSNVMWTVCHKDTFWIRCTVTDKYNNSENKTIDVICQ